MFFALTFGLSACGKSSSSSEENPGASISAGYALRKNIQEISYTTESSLLLFDGLSCSTTTFSGDVTEELCTEANLKDGYISSDGMEFSQTIQEGDGCLDDLDLFACLDGESE